MTQTSDALGQWQKRLEDTFAGPNGICGERGIDLRRAESDHLAQLLQSTGGYVRLMDAFFDFFLHTLNEAHEHTPRVNAFAYAIFIATFRRFRASYNVFWDGYYRDASALLRAIIENVLYYGAYLHGYIALHELYQTELPIPASEMPLKEFFKHARKHRFKLDKKIRLKMLGDESFQDQKQRDHLNLVLGTLHTDVHRSESNIVEIMNQFVKEKGTYLMPHADPELASSFANVSYFAAWCCVRLLPFISSPRLFTDDWKNRYTILDDSFAFYNKGLTGHLAELGEAYEHFIRKQLTFAMPKESE